MEKLTEKINGDVQLIKCKNKICAAICITYGAWERLEDMVRNGRKNL